MTSLAKRLEALEARNRGGRPRERDEVKRAAITIRTTSAIKEQVKAAAEANGRSVTQEIEFRLERSFDYEGAADYLRQALARQFA